MICFANDKLSTFNTKSERESELMTCYCLEPKALTKMKKEGKCGTFKCPFFKPNRKDIRDDDRIRTDEEVALMKRYSSGIAMLNYIRLMFQRNGGILLYEDIFGTQEGRDGKEER